MMPSFVAFIIDVLQRYTAFLIYTLIFHYYGHLFFQPTHMSNTVKEIGECGYLRHRQYKIVMTVNLGNGKQVEIKKTD